MNSFDSVVPFHFFEFYRTFFSFRNPQCYNDLRGYYNYWAYYWDKYSDVTYDIIAKYKTF